MLRITLKLPVGTRDELAAAVALRLGVEADAFALFPRRRSIDAREKPVYVWVADLSFADKKREKALLKKYGKLLTPTQTETPYVFPAVKRTSVHRPIVVGFGPAGIFCALMLARSGLKPIVLERGGSMEERVAQLRSGFMDDLFDEAGRLDKLTIENLTISGKMTEEEKAEIQKRFPKAVINNR